MMDNFRSAFLWQSCLCIWDTSYHRFHCICNKNTGTLPSSFLPRLALWPGLVSLHLQREGNSYVLYEPHTTHGANLGADVAFGRRFLNFFSLQSWVCAAKECFFTWSFFGGSLLQLASHNKFKRNLRRDTTIIILVTLLFLVVSGILGVAIHKLLETSGQYTYIPSSFGEFSTTKVAFHLSS